MVFCTRSCGVCKELLIKFQVRCDEAKAAQVNPIPRETRVCLHVNNSTPFHAVLASGVRGAGQR
jgi:hypothetical protein